VPPIWLPPGSGGDSVLGYGYREYWVTTLSSPFIKFLSRKKVTDTFLNL